MITSVDTSALLCILKGEPLAEDLINLLIHQASIGKLVICDIVAAELSCFFESQRDLEICLRKLNVELTPLGIEACYEAGKTFRSYKSKGGKRDRLIPDFLIASHALKQSDAFVTLDRGYFREYFPKLKILKI